MVNEDFLIPCREVPSLSSRQVCLCKCRCRDIDDAARNLSQINRDRSHLGRRIAFGSEGQRQRGHSWFRNEPTIRNVPLSPPPDSVGVELNTHLLLRSRDQAENGGLFPWDWATLRSFEADLDQIPRTIRGFHQNAGPSRRLKQRRRGHCYFRNEPTIRNVPLSPSLLIKTHIPGDIPTCAIS